MICLNPMTFRVAKELKGKPKGYWNDFGIKFITVPCGKCVACLRRRQRSWSIRLSVENWSSLSSFFVTLTYSDDFLPEDGVSVKHCQDFFKRLRKKVKFRYFLVSEYGDKFLRPHYHVIFFFRMKMSSLDLLHHLSDTWPYGSVKIGTVTAKSINYCCKYALKPKNNPDGKRSVFMLCSRRPGLGELSEKAKEDIHSSADFKMYGFGLSGLPLPRYYRDKIYTPTEIGRYNKELQSLYGLHAVKQPIKMQVEEYKLIKKHGKTYE